MSTVFLLLDAFRHDYLSEEVTPFLWRCAQKGEHYLGVEQSLGFCERSEILTGLCGDETGFFTAIGFDPQNSPYAKAPWLRFFHVAEETVLLLLRLFPINTGDKIHKKLRHLISCYFQRIGTSMSTYSIPYLWLPYFALTEDRIDHRSPTAFPTPSILTLLERAGRTYYYDTFTALNFRSSYQSDSERLNAVICDVAESPKDLYLVYIAAPDAYGHRYGPSSPAFQEILHRLDGELERFVLELERTAPGNRYLFLGDHGMLKVTTKVNAEKEISRLLHLANLSKGQDVIYFLDSTMVRLWAISNRARCLLPDILILSELFNENGRWMTNEMAKHNHVPWPDRRYGDYLWTANPSVLVFPDFFHRLAPCAGMHGYDPKLPESQGMCIHWGDGIPSSQHSTMLLTEVFSLLKRSLRL